MLTDKIFKNLLHSYAAYEPFLKGGQLEDGYKPDFVLRNHNDFIILESETSTSRKSFVGGMIKAAHFLQQERTGILIFIIKTKKNVNAAVIAKHLNKYFNWISVSTNLREIWVIDAGHYYNNSVLLNISSADFLKLAHPAHVLRS